jgi:hypothetical protein
VIDGVREVSSAFRDRSAAVPTSVSSRDAATVLAQAAGGTDESARLVSFNSDGFGVTWLRQSAGTLEFGFLALGLRAPADGGSGTADAGGGVDAGAQPDAGVDAETDADAGARAESDAGVDAGADADAEPPEPPATEPPPRAAAPPSPPPAPGFSTFPEQPTRIKTKRARADATAAATNEPTSTAIAVASSARASWRPRTEVRCDDVGDEARRTPIAGQVFQRLRTAHGPHPFRYSIADRAQLERLR